MNEKFYRRRRSLVIAVAAVLLMVGQSHAGRTLSKPADRGASADLSLAEGPETIEPDSPKRRFWLFGRRKDVSVEAVPLDAESPSPAVEAVAVSEEPASPKRRFWLFGRRKDASVEAVAVSEEPASPKRRFWQFGRRKDVSVEAVPLDAESASPAVEAVAASEEPDSPKRRFWLFGRRKDVSVEAGPTPEQRQRLSTAEQSMITQLVLTESKPSTPVRPTGQAPVLRTGMLLDILVMVAGEKEIEAKSKRIETDGTVSLPFVGKFPASSKTLAEFQEALSKRYDTEFFVNPQVVVDFSPAGNDYSSPWGHVTVFGAVSTPGRISIPPTQDLVVSQAIQASGGCTHVAKMTSIRVTRQNAAGAPKTSRINLNDVGEMRQADLVLAPGDMIFVPERIF
jgi:protein involved in polysaccharide export with SLBB domain